MGLSTEAGLLPSAPLHELGLARPGLVFARTFGFAIALTVFFAASQGAIAHVPAPVLVERVAKARNPSYATPPPHPLHDTPRDALPPSQPLRRARLRLG